MKQIVSILILLWLISACTDIPDGIDPVEGFDSQRYLGKWYEIARLENSFEEGLSGVTADYQERDDGGIRVTNSGYLADGELRQAVGKAYLVGEPNTGHLKVSFFGPFYASYVIFELDENYRYAYVTSNDRDYLWFLSRTPVVTEQQKQAFMDKAVKSGFNLDKLVFVDQTIPETNLIKEHK